MKTLFDKEFSRFLQNKNYTDEQEYMKTVTTPVVV